MQNELSSLQAIINDPEFVQDLKRQIERRKKKRVSTILDTF